jgi:hypothetical protein
MKLLHMVNAALWLANAVTWYAYAHSTPMAIASVGATALSILMWRIEP